MFKRKSSGHPSTPKLGSVDLPEPFSPQNRLSSSYSETRPPPKSSSNSFFNRFRSSPSLPIERTTTHQVSLAEAARRPRGISNATDTTADDDEDDGDDDYIDPRRPSRRDSFLPPNTVDMYIPRPSQVGNAALWLRMKEEADAEDERERRRSEREIYAKKGIKVEIKKSKAQLEEEKEWEEELNQQLALKREAQRHPNARITLVKSKAAIEEEQEREEEERQREWREMDEAKKAAKKKLPPPLKSCLKNSPSSLQSRFATPSPPTNPSYNNPAYAANPQHDLRRSSTNYYSDTEQYRPAYRSARRSNTFHGAQPQQQQQQLKIPPMQQPTPHPHPPVRADTYPPDPRFVPQTNMEWAYPSHLQTGSNRVRGLSITAPQPGSVPFVPPPAPQQVTPPGQLSSRYKKAYVKPESNREAAATVPAAPTPTWKHKHEDTVLLWPLVDPADRPRNVPPSPGEGTIFFDIAFDPRLREFEIQVMRYGERVRSPLTRAEEKSFVCPQAHFSDMWLFHEGFPQWPVYVKATKGNVRVVDVFRAIYDAFAVPLTQSEVAGIGSRERERCQRWFEQRCKDTPGLPPVTAGKGMCRIDVLRGRRIFKGLKPVSGPSYPVNSYLLELQRMGGDER